MPSTIRLHRVLLGTPERVYPRLPRSRCHGQVAAAVWLHRQGPPHRRRRSAARYKMSFTNFTTGNSHSFGGKYLELKPNELIRYTDKFDDPNLPGEMW